MKTLLVGAALSVSVLASAQNQSWTATDINGNQISIQALLNEGKTVLVDISAHWCGPCWAWHKSHIMDKLYHEFGPNGTNDLTIIWVDGDDGSNMTLLQGGSGSQGNWIEGTEFPIIGPNGEGNALATAYGTTAYPTLYMHCPGSNAGVEIDREATWEQFLASWKNACPSAFNNGAIDAHLLEVANSEVCVGGNPVADVFNQGTSALTSCQLLLKENGNVIDTKNWTGSIAPFQHSLVTFENTTITGPVEYEVECVLTGDANLAGNIENSEFTLAPAAPSTLVTLELKTDNYGSETTWKLFNSSGGVVAQDPPGNYANNTTYTYNWSLNPSECYTFTIYDAYGDGICCTYGQGYYKIKNSWGAPVDFVEGGAFGGEESKGYDTPATVGVQENDLDNGLSIFPNPSNGIVNLQFSVATQATVDVFNVLGERVMTSTFNTNGLRTLDMGAFSNGLYYLNVTAGELVATRKITISK